MKKYKLLIGLVAVLVVAGVSLAFAYGGNLQGLIFNVKNKAVQQKVETIQPKIDPKAVTKLDTNKDLCKQHPLLCPGLTKSKKSTGDEIKYLNDYSNLKAVKTALEDIKILDNPTLTFPVNGYDLVKKVLQSGYYGFSTNAEKETFFKTYLNIYPLQYSASYSFIRQVVHSLWLESSGIVPWSIATYSENQALLLYPALFLVESAKNTQSIFPNVPIFPANTKASKILDSPGPTLEFATDVITKTFLLSRKLTSSTTTQEKAVLEIIKWAEKNFTHANYKYSWDVYKNDGVSAGPIFEPKNLSRYFEERIGGCHEPANLIQGMLNSLNIPALNITWLGHGVVYMPSLNKYIHGDHIADFSVVPPESLLLTQSEISALSPTGGYEEIIYNKYSPLKYYFTNIAVDRNGEYLSLTTDSVCIAIPDADWKTMSDQALQEYILNYDQANCLITSSQNKIHTLEELSAN